MGSVQEHQQLVDDILYAVGSLPNVRCWPRFVGFDRERKIKYGIKGEPDIDGVIGPNGRKLSIEVKSGNAVLSLDQRRFKDMLVKFGVVYIEGRSVEQVLAELKRYL